MPSCMLRKYSLKQSGVGFFSMPGCVLHKNCRSDCREVLYRGSCVYFSLFFSRQSQVCISFMKGRFREAVALNLNYPCDNSLYSERVSVSPERTHADLSLQWAAGSTAVQTKYCACVCACVSGSVTCMMRTLFCHTTELSLWSGNLFTVAAMLMYLYGLQGSFLTMTTSCHP